MAKVTQKICNLIYANFQTMMPRTRGGKWFFRCCKRNLSEFTWSQVCTPPPKRAIAIRTMASIQNDLTCRANPPVQAKHPPRACIIVNWQQNRFLKETLWSALNNNMKFRRKIIMRACKFCYPSNNHPNILYKKCHNRMKRDTDTSRLHWNVSKAMAGDVWIDKILRILSVGRSTDKSRRRTDSHVIGRCDWCWKDLQICSLQWFQRASTVGAS